jgi:hypothetical protein
MAPHLTSKELDQMLAKSTAGATPAQIHSWLKLRREKAGTAAPNITNVRKALKGKSYRRGKVETRGRKKTLTRRNVLQLNSTRKKLIKKADSEYEVHWTDVVRGARVPGVHTTTAARSFKREGFDVEFRRSRERPQREQEHLDERADICRRWQRLPANYFLEKVDLIMDNKKFSIPTYARAVRHLKMSRVGIKPGFTKPNQKKNRVNPGASVNVCGGIINGKIKMWHYLPDNWNGQVAADNYKAVRRALVAHSGPKEKYRILEDNDPAGYKSKKGEASKATLGIVPIEYPRHSPDLNPLDFYVWNEVERKALKSLSGPITKEQYKAKLRRSAMNLPEEQVRKAVLAIRTRAKAVLEAGGGDIPRD